MKKSTFIVLTLLMVISGNVMAQKKSAGSEYKSAIGLRLGSPISASLKHFFTKAGAGEAYAGLGSPGYGSYVVIGVMYEHHFPIGDIEGFQWYVGGGALVRFNNYDRYYNNLGYSSTGLGINAVGGVDYKFANIPLNVSADWTPTVFVGGSNYYNSFGPGYGALSARYVFK